MSSKRGERRLATRRHETKNVTKFVDRTIIEKERAKEIHGAEISK